MGKKFIKALFAILPPHAKERGAPRVYKRALVQEHESKALHAFKNRFNEKENDLNVEEEFVKEIKQSPSVHTIDYGIVLATEAGWHMALKELFSIDPSTYKSFKSESSFQHPLRDHASSQLDLPLAVSSESRGQYVNAALLYAIVSGRVETVRVLARYMDLNIDDRYDEPLLHYVYLLDQQDARRQMLDIVVPKLKPSFKNMSKAAKNGDLETTKHFAKNLESKDRSLAYWAGVHAILGGHDDVAKWIIEASGFINMKIHMSSLVDAAVKRENIGMIEYLSTRSPVFFSPKFGHILSSTLWPFLKRVNRRELFGKFVPSHPKGYLR